MLEILKIIEYYGYEAYFVGGYPRNLYMNIACDDYDICTNATPQELLNIFPNCDMTFAIYGNVKVQYKDNLYEITTFRKDLEYDFKRHPKIVFVKTLKEDLLRRDFTINTLCLNANGEYIDLLGARKDIDAKIIKTVGDSDCKIKEDPLRIIRALRFACDFDFQLDEKLISSIIKYKKNVYDLNPDKVKMELAKVQNKEKLALYLKKFALFNL